MCHLDYRRQHSLLVVTRELLRRIILRSRHLFEFGRVHTIERLRHDSGIVHPVHPHGGGIGHKGSPDRRCDALLLLFLKESRQFHFAAAAGQIMFHPFQSFDGETENVRKKVEPKDSTRYSTRTQTSIFDVEIRVFWILQKRSGLFGSFYSSNFKNKRSSRSIPVVSLSTLYRENLIRRERERLLLLLLLQTTAHGIHCCSIILFLNDVETANPSGHSRCVRGGRRLHGHPLDLRSQSDGANGR